MISHGTAPLHNIPTLEDVLNEIPPFLHIIGGWNYEHLYFLRRVVLAEYSLLTPEELQDISSPVSRNWVLDKPPDWPGWQASESDEMGVKLRPRRSSKPYRRAKRYHPPTFSPAIFRDRSSSALTMLVRVCFHRLSGLAKEWCLSEISCIVETIQKDAGDHISKNGKNNC